MNEANFKEITETWLPRIGFPNGLLDGQIRDMMVNNPDKMTAVARDMIGQNEIRYEVSFGRNEKKPEDTTLYLNTITATLQSPDGETRKRDFQYYYGQGFNLEQIGNIMEGRHVHRDFTSTKTGEDYSVWTAIDLNRKDEKGYNVLIKTFDNTTGFDLAREASKIPFAGMTGEEKNNMLRELRNGNEYHGNIKMPDQSTERGKAVALPHINQVAAYSMDGKRLQFNKSTMQAIPPVAKQLANADGLGGGGKKVTTK